MTYTWGPEVKAQIWELYCRQNKSLKDVMATVNKEFPGMEGAKERTYQKYLKKWGFTKGSTPRSRQQPSRTYSNQQNPRSNARRPRIPRQASPNPTAISENTPSDDDEGCIVSTVDPILVESTAAMILNTISLSHSPRSTGLSFVGPASSTDFPDYITGASTIGESHEAGNSMSTGEMAGIRMYPDTGIDSDMGLTSNPMPQMIIDQADRPSLSPLAQGAVEAYLRSRSLPLRDYWELYAETGRKLVQNSEQETDESVYADIIPFEIPLQELPSEDDKILLFCSFAGGSDIALDVLLHFLKRPQEIINSSIENLSGYGLVSQHGGNISIEGSIKNWLWIRNNLPTRHPFVQEMMIQVSNSLSLGHTPSETDWDNARRSARYFEELTDSILRFKDSGASIWDKDTLRAAVVIADTARRVGKNKQAGMILENILPILKNICGDKDPLTLSATNALSVAFINLKNWSAAEGHLKTLIEIQKQFPDIKGCSYVTQLSNWAWVLVHLGKHNDARLALTTIAELGKRVDDPVQVFVHRLKLAATQRICGDLKEAEGLLLQVLKDSRNILREDDSQTMRALEVLCYVYYDQKSLAQAELNSSKLVKLSQQAFGPSQLDTVRRVKFHEKIRRKRGKQRE